MRNIQQANRNIKCYGNRNIKCYDLRLRTNWLSMPYKKFVTKCYGQKRVYLTDYKPLTRYRNTKNRNIFIFKNPLKKHEVILKAKSSGVLYKIVGKNEYMNISTGVSGTIDKNIVSKHLEVPMVLNSMLAKNRKLGLLILTFGLEIAV